MALTPQEEAGIRERAAIAVAEAEAAKEKAAKSKTQAAANTIPKTSNGVQEKNSARYSQMENTYNELLSNVTSDVKNDIKNGDIVNILKDSTLSVEEQVTIVQELSLLSLTTLNPYSSHKVSDTSLISA